MINVRRSPERKLAKTSVTNDYADAINTLAQLFNSGSGQVQDMAILPVRFKLVSAAGGGGKYAIRMLNPPIQGINPASNLSAADFGDDPGAENAWACNAQEMGKSTHDLTMTPVVVQYFTGFLYHYATDGKPVIAFNGLDVKDCTTSPGGDFAPAEDPSVYHTATGASGATAIASR
jgi:hypothetical protein